jgi:hypothetical protein
MSIQLSFQGATDTVTGSRYLVETGGARVLVDCGPGASDAFRRRLIGRGAGDRRAHRHGVGAAPASLRDRAGEQLSREGRARHRDPPRRASCVLSPAHPCARYGVGIGSDAVIA